MLSFTKSRTILVGAAVLAVVAGATVAISASAAIQPNGSQAPVYIGDSNTNALIPAGSVIDWNDDNFGFNNPADVSTPYVCPADATGSVTFLAPKGQEFTMANYSAVGSSLFYPAGSKNVAQFTTSPYQQNVGNAAAVKAAGGDYSIGLACTINNGSKLASTGVFFASIHVTAVTGKFTVDQPTETGSTTPPTPPTGSADLNLKATTLAAQDGVLSLVAPAATTVLIGNPVLDPATQLSTSTGTLGDVKVSDGRVASHTGWDLTTKVTDFVLEGDNTKTISKAQLGFAPKLISKPTGANITAGTKQAAGTAVYDAAFASADNGVNVGDTVVNADLTFVAPATAAAGTYDSTLTLTLTSK
ncbi:hypothetical protein [Lacisediminihabitans changchengi]|uniref:WxL domain-containing protein n=1 Tax=Lacisediminihabitans changchengi TaxID=2787634 RepID=A0A934SNK3_9MICO|nr:hypothetical protein [Lacisediminihabitans changchengi]MBK4348609.1 hypothetical protein [Lacisediminihabitans changchengi]